MAISIIGPVVQFGPSSSGVALVRFSVISLLAAIFLVFVRFARKRRPTNEPLFRALTFAGVIVCAVCEFVSVTF